MEPRDPKILPICQAETSSAHAAPSIPGDAFTAEEIERSLDPLSCQFNPSREYALADIGSLVPGPKAVTFFGRIANFNVHHGRSKSHAAATGWHNLIVKDDTGAICVKLYFANTPYTLKLGLLVTIWTPYVGYICSDNNNFAVRGVPNTTSIFPGREASVHIVIHHKSGDICNTPLEYSIGKPLPGLMTVKSFLSGGSEVIGAKILACVKSINPQKIITTKKGPVSVLTEVNLFDDTSFIKLNLWGDLGISVQDWKPSETILLISNPSCKSEFRGVSIGLTHSTMVDIDPDISDANWLRRYAGELTKVESVSQEFPEGLWDVDAVVNGSIRVLFNIAEIDALVRSEPWEYHTGFLNLTILGISLVLYFQRNMLMCSQCCGKPIYANEATSKCNSCEKIAILRLNPNIIGMLIDETGCIAPGKLLWSEEAWEELFGRPVHELIAFDQTKLSWMEQRLLFMRMHFVFGWADEVGKLSILGVRM